MQEWCSLSVGDRACLQSPPGWWIEDSLEYIPSSSGFGFGGCEEKFVLCFVTVALPLLPVTFLGGRDVTLIGWVEGKREGWVYLIMSG